MMIYRWLVEWHKTRLRSALLRRYWRLLGRGEAIPSVADYMRQCAPDHSLADVGGMWGIHGEHSLLAEEMGARSVVLVDTYQTPEFEKKRQERGSAVTFVAADASAPDLVEKIGVVDAV